MTLRILYRSSSQADITILHGKGNKATGRRFHPSINDSLHRWIDVRQGLGFNGKHPFFCT